MEAAGDASGGSAMQRQRQRGLQSPEAMLRIMTTEKAAVAEGGREEAQLLHRQAHPSRTGRASRSAGLVAGRQAEPPLQPRGGLLCTMRLGRGARL